MDKAEIKKRILDKLGNPTTGAIVQHIDDIVDAVVGDDSSSSKVKPTKETRIVEATETR